MSNTRPIILTRLGIGLSLALGGCITVKAPDKPIVIELNVNIKQEVIYRLSGDAAQTIDKNAEIF
ncbi:YnbE family lipoprotein [Novosphingobium sp.]|uniref:YnbE family lipoprotein n=1 Tax=Novosphingobium sp. TaxID=1874826 RepID=UPI003B51E556